MISINKKLKKVYFNFRRFWNLISLSKNIYIAMLIYKNIKKI